MSKKTMLIVVAVACAALGAGVATATIPDSGGTIHGCYKKTTGNLTLIDTGKGATCQASEAAVTWSQQGVQGLPGQQGVQGQQGSQGSAGPDGVDDYSIATGQATTSGGNATAVASCPTGSTSVGGGFDVPASADVTPYESAHSGTTWTVTFYGDDGVTFTAYAVCVGKQQLMGS
jgi:hypothetical protein